MTDLVVLLIADLVAMVVAFGKAVGTAFMITTNTAAFAISTTMDTQEETRQKCLW